jgi:hypothetical protein
MRVRNPLIVSREKNKVLAVHRRKLLIGDAMDAGGGGKLRESHAKLRNKNQEVATFWSEPPDR